MSREASPTGSTYISEFETRCQKIQELKNQNIPAWPESKTPSMTIAEARKSDTATYEQKEFALVGRVLQKREHGKAVFLTIEDFSSPIQLYIKQDLVGEQSFEYLTKYIDIGDYLWVKGVLFITKTNELTLKVSQFELLSKCLHGIPEKLNDTEQRYRNRSVDLLVNKEVRQRFIARSIIIRTIRSFLDSSGFLEVETPMLHPIPGGAAARPFVTHHNALDSELYLRIAPELYLKRLVIGGLERVYEINRNFRNEGVSTRHNPEFTMLEFYLAHHNYEYAMSFVEELIRAALLASVGKLNISYGSHSIDFSQPFARLTPLQAIIKYGKISEEELTKERVDKTLTLYSIVPNPTWSYQQKIFALFEHTAEKNLIQPTYIIDFPIELSPLSKARTDRPDTAARFELFIAGMEISNGFNELNDPFDQADRFKKQVEARDAGDEEAMYFDADYIHALEYGLPPTVGVGIGIDRLIMLATGVTSIKDVILFPALKQKE